MLFLTCAGGVEALLADEVRSLLAQDGRPAAPADAVEAARGGVWVDAPEGDLHAALRLNLGSRLATRVLLPLVDGPYRDEHDLYALARRVDWDHWLTPADTLRVDVQAVRSPLKSLNFAALRIKDAICDALRERHGERPSVDTRRPVLPVALFVGPEHAMLYADTSGEPLFKRGWREDTGEAPLKETLAAAMLAAAGWQGRAEDGPLLDPCCGAGTVAIEAAQMACGIAPGLQRRFAFERQRPFAALRSEWAALQQQARARVHAPTVPVFAGDVSFRMTDFATRNAERAGVAGALVLKTADALQRLPPAAAGTIVMNPPYGERIGAKGSGSGSGSGPGAAAASREAFEGGGTPEQFFGALATHWKHHYAGWTAWVLSPEMKLPGLMRLKESRRVPLYNGAIECRLFRFDLVAGAGPSRGSGSGNGNGSA